MKDDEEGEPLRNETSFSMRKCRSSEAKLHVLKAKSTREIKS